MVLGMTVRQIGLPWGPSDVELFHSVFQPPALAIVSFAASLLDGALNKTLGSDVISLNSSWWLRVLQCVETIPHGDQFMSVHVKGCHLRFGCTAHHTFDSLGQHMDWSIELSVVLGAWTDAAGCSTSGVWCDIKCCI